MAPAHEAIRVTSGVLRTHPMKAIAKISSSALDSIARTIRVLAMKGIHSGCHLAASDPFQPRPSIGDLTRCRCPECSREPRETSRDSSRFGRYPGIPGKEGLGRNPVPTGRALDRAESGIANPSD